ncbi:hypothetical protein MAUB1S_03185 [Mycolicibacterium aubagnense]
MTAAAPRVPYAEASRVLLRHSILDGMPELLLTKDWSSITLSDVARAAGISRQTIYNEFGSRQGLAEGYAMRLADRLVDAVEHAIYANVGDIHAAFLQGFRMFFTESASDPLVISLLGHGQRSRTCCRSSPPTARRSSRTARSASQRLSAAVGCRFPTKMPGCWLARSSGWRSVTCQCRRKRTTMWPLTWPGS